MGPKSKSKWKECSGCNAIIWEKDEQQHKEQCEDVKTESDRCVVMNHGLINEDGFYAVVYKKRDDKNLPESLYKDAVFLHPSAMKICRMCFGNRVTVTSSSGCQTIHTVLPKLTIPPTSVFFLDKNFSKYHTGKIVKIQNYQKHLIKASSITLSCCNSSHNDCLFTSEFKKYVLQQNYDCCVTHGTKIFCSFAGYCYELIVTDIIPEIDSSNEINHSSADDVIVQEMSTLSLEITDTSFSAIDSRNDTSLTCSTPLKNNTSSTFESSKSSILEKEYFPKSCQQTQHYIITLSTRIKIMDETVKRNENIKKITFDAIGGLEYQIGVLKELLSPLNFPEHFKNTGIQLPRGVLLYGLPGTGKTMLGCAVANECKANFILINGPEIYSKYYGESETKLREIFNEAIERAPSVIFIDEIDALCPKREGAALEVERRVVATLLSLIDRLAEDIKMKVFLIGATNRPDSLDEALRRPGRFDRELEIGFPSASGRYEILSKLLSKMKHALSDTEIRSIANKLHGFTGADLAALCRNVNLVAMKDCSPEESYQPVISFSHFSVLMETVKPSALKEVNIEVPKVYWTEIGGMNKLQHKLKQAVEWPLKYPEIFKNMGISQMHGLLMYGPPGCSKTMVARALATESGLNFIAIKGPELFSKWVGESERSVREVFQRAKSVAPCIIFFDEIDALAAERGSSGGGTNVGDRVLTQLLTEIDGMEQLKDVFVIAATNRPDMIDKALLRSGRLDSIIYIPLPDNETRKEIFQIQMKKMPVSDDMQIQLLTEYTEGYSGAEIIAVCHEAALKALTENIEAKEIKWCHFLAALEIIKPRTSSEMIEYYEQYHKTSGVISL